jgi:hypothetical protein
VLAGLTKPVAALSFEFTTIQRDVAVNCLAALAALGPYTFNVALGESQKLEFATGLSRLGMQGYLLGLPHTANSGDVYAMLG